ncbi:hypothetical protein PIB30_012255, partial [Stylosanthes scabra]|nr:hypothetical protein [Stylosanthes scabra]
NLAKGASKDGHGGKTGRPGTQASAQAAKMAPNSTILAPRRPSNIFMHQAAAPAPKHLVRIPCSGA